MSSELGDHVDGELKHAREQNAAAPRVAKREKVRSFDA